MFKQHHVARYIAHNRDTMPRPAFALKELNAAATDGLIEPGTVARVLGEEHAQSLSILARRGYYTNVKAASGGVEDVLPYLSVDDLKCFLARYPETVADRAAADEQIEGCAEGGYVHHEYVALVFGAGGLKSFESFLKAERAKREPSADHPPYMLPG